MDLYALASQLRIDYCTLHVYNDCHAVKHSQQKRNYAHHPCHGVEVKLVHFLGRVLVALKSPSQ